MAKSVGSLVVQMEADLGKFKKDMTEATATTRNMSNVSTEAQFKASAAGKAIAQSAREAAAAKRAQATATRLVVREMTTGIGVSDRLSRTISNTARSFGGLGKNASAAQRQLALMTLKTAGSLIAVQAIMSAVSQLIETLSERRWAGVNNALDNITSRLETMSYTYDRAMFRMGRAHRFSEEAIKGSNELKHAKQDAATAEELLALAREKAALVEQRRSVEEIDALIEKRNASQQYDRALQGLQDRREELGRANQEAAERERVAGGVLMELQFKAAEAEEALQQAQNKRANTSTTYFFDKNFEKADKAVEKANNLYREALNAQVKAEKDLAQARQDGRMKVIALERLDSERRRLDADKERQETERRTQRRLAALDKEKQKVEEVLNVRRGGVGLVTGVGSVASYRARQQASAEAGFARIAAALIAQRAESVFDQDDKQVFKDMRDLLKDLATQETVIL